jgi:hypothetical protein
MSIAPVPGPFRPSAGTAVPAQPRPPSVDRPADPADGARGVGHPAVDAAIQAIVNAAALSPADQIAQYEAAHRTLQETLATIDQA